MNSDKAPDAFRTISEAAEDLSLEQHVLRFWETRFIQIKPLKRGGGRRYYRPDDVDFLRGLRHLLHDERYTIKGVQKIIKEQGVKAVIAAGRGEAVVAPKVAAPGLVRSAVAQVRRPVSIPPRQAAPPVQPAPLPPIVLPDNAGWRDRLEAAMAELVTARQVLASV